jgi:nitronate monooxygenase
VEAWEAAGRPPSGSRPGEDDEPATRADGSPINRYTSSTPTAEVQGDIEPLSLWAGQGVGLVTREESAADILHALVAEAERAISSLG